MALAGAEIEHLGGRASEETVFAVPNAAFAP
jgi:hypothetical protein